MAGNRGLGLGAVALVLIGLGADDAVRTIDAGGLTFEAPASWKSSPPRSSMRRAQITVAPVEGDAEPAELIVYAFPGGAGSVEANVKRWQGQFRDDSGGNPPVDTKTIKGQNVEITRVEAAGRFVAPEMPGSAKMLDKPHFHLLGAIVPVKDTAYFLKMLGPDKTMVAARPAFDRMLATIKAE